MAYIGRQPSYGSHERQDITGDGSTTTFTLTYTIGSTASILVSQAAVVQQPGSGYTITNGGTQIVFASAPASGETTFIIFLGVAQDVGTVGTGIITDQTDLGAAPATTDSFLIHDADASALKEMTVANLFTSPTITSGVIVTSLDMNGTELVLDADGDTSITADTDDQIDVRIAGADDFQFTAHKFTVSSGSEANFPSGSKITGPGYVGKTMVLAMIFGS